MQKKTEKKKKTRKNFGTTPPRPRGRMRPEVGSEKNLFFEKKIFFKFFFAFKVPT